MSKLIRRFWTDNLQKALEREVILHLIDPIDELVSIKALRRASYVDSAFDTYLRRFKFGQFDRLHVFKSSNSAASQLKKLAYDFSNCRIFHVSTC